MNEFELDRTFENMDLEETFASAKQSLKKFKEKVDELKGFDKDDLFIYEYFAELRNKIDINREVIRLAISEHYLKLIDEVEAIEARCMSKSTYVNKSIDEEVKKLDETFKKFDLDKLELDNWKNIRSESNHQVIKSNEMIQKFKNACSWTNLMYCLAKLFIHLFYRSKL